MLSVMVTIMIEGDCIEWRGTVSNAGYGTVQVGGKTKKAHRIAYEEARGKIPHGLVLDHLCRNRKCVNPWHLEAVTNEENVLRGVGSPALNARKTTCKNGHPFTTENTNFYQGRKGKRRICKTCAHINAAPSQRAHRAKKRAAMEAAQNSVNGG